jgi:outer membrane receptor protein involved in Fe transport
MSGARALAAGAWRAALAGAGWLAWAAGAEELEPPVRPLYEIEVTAPTPLLGRGVERGRVPAHVQSLDREALDEHPGERFAETLAREVAGASLTDSQGSPFNATLNFRGYTASPVLGAPQGLAVYQNGVRVNDPFGEVVSWALLPDFAIERLEVHPGTNPAFGLNAQGGALLLRTKDGFSAPGGRVHLDGGSHPNGTLVAEYGASSGGLGIYGGVRTLYDAGWRDHSPGELHQGLLDLAREGETGRLQLTLGLGAADFTGNGPAPRELLEQDYPAVYTRPDRTEALAFDATLRGARGLGERSLLQGTAYFRSADTDTLNGDEADFDACTGIAAGGDTLCTEAGEPGESVLTDAAGRPLPSSLDVSGALNETRTRSRATGASLQLAHERTLWGRTHEAVVGASLDLGFVDYRARSRAGELDGSRAVDDLGLLLGGEDFETRLAVTNRYFGLHAADTIRLGGALSLTLSGRVDVAQLDLDDLLGSDLNGSHAFVRVKPAVGLNWAVSPALGLYASYGEASRAPTAAELGCADPERACRVPNAFSADPPLDQVVTRTVEVGARGRVSGELTLDWSAAAFAAWNQDDILFVSAGPVIGSGYFTNAGTTRRLGFEASLEGRWKRLGWFVRYGFLHATFESRLRIASPHHPAADASGRISVGRGDRLPNLPQHALAVGASYALTDAWSIGARAYAASSRRLQGDESNQLSSVPGYGILDVETRYRVADRIAVQLRVANLLDREYATAGILGEPDEVFPSFDDPRFVTPGEPRSYEATVRLSF